MGGSGTLGWSAPHVGRMAFTLAADSLIAFDSLLLARRDRRGTARPTASRWAGRPMASVQLAGSLDTLEMSGDLLAPEAGVAADQLAGGNRGIQLDRRHSGRS